jgi:hypothetical protein
VLGYRQISRYQQAKRKHVVRAPALDLKLLRDLLNHPTVTKCASDSGSRNTVLLDSADVYGISLELEAAGHEIDRWLNAVCVNLPYERFCDTKRMAEDFSRALGAEPTSIRRF